MNDGNSTVFLVTEIRNASFPSDIRTPPTKSNKEREDNSRLTHTKAQQTLTHQTQPGIKRIQHNQLGQIPGRQYKFVCVNNPDVEIKTTYVTP